MVNDLPQFAVRWLNPQNWKIIFSTQKIFDGKDPMRSPFFRHLLDSLWFKRLISNILSALMKKTPEDIPSDILKSSLRLSQDWRRLKTSTDKDKCSECDQPVIKKCWNFTNEKVFWPRYDSSRNTYKKPPMATEKNKKRIVPSLDVIKSDLTIGFSVVDLVGKEVWLVDFFLKCGFFQRLKSEK